MYHLEKNVPLSPAVHNTTEHEYNQTEAFHLRKNDLNHFSDILENYYEEADEVMKVPEPSNNLKEVQSANQIPVLPNSSPITVNCPGGLVDNRKLNEDEEWRNEIAKSNLLLITHPRKTCSRCTICKQWILTRREALLHLKTLHPECYADHAKLPRIHLHRKKTY